MKKTTLIAVAILGLAHGALAQRQGNFLLDNTTITSGLALDIPGKPYGGAFGIEVWVLRGTNVPAGINLGPAPGYAVLSYAAMQAAGFVKEATYTNQQATAEGVFTLGAVFMPHAHSGGTVVLALAAWNSSAPSWGAMRATASQTTRAGVVVFEQPTTPLLANPGIPAALAMDRDLVLAAVRGP